MKKLKLDLNELEVESFKPAETVEQRGTVQGNWFTQYERYCRTDYPPGECYPTNIGCETWEAACQPTYEPTCNAASCHGTCGISCGCSNYCTGESCDYICP